ncbi:MAG: hypothetical protein ACTSQ5_12695 [Promethearchaeota archaeon]
MKKLSREDHENVNRELDQTKKKAINFFKGFLMTYGLMILLSITSHFIISYVYLCPSYLNPYYHKEILFTFPCGDLRIILRVLISLVIFVILIIVIDGFTRNKNPYTWIGKINAIFGLLFLIIKTNGEQLVDPHTEDPEKKKKHILFGFLLSIGLLIIYFPLFFWGGITTELFGIWSLVVVFIILLNISLGVLIFFFKENFRYISIGMIFLPFMWTLLFILLVIDFY